MKEIKNIGDRIVVRDPSGEFDIIGEVGHIVTFPPVVVGMYPVVLYYVRSFDETKNTMTDPEVDFEYYDVIDSNSDLIIDDEEEVEKNTIVSSFE